MDEGTFRTLFDSHPDGLILLDARGAPTLANRSACRLLGTESEALVGKSLRDLLPGLEEGLLEGIAPGHGEALCALAAEGKETVLAVRIAPLEGAGDSRQVVILRDVTASQAVRQLQTYFLANITHEFRTPLSALKASVELMLETLGEASQDELERLLRSVHYSVAGLQALIDNLLASASVESGTFRIYPQEVLLAEVVGEAARVMSPLLKRREQGLQIEMDWSLPPVRVDPTRITQVLVNLLSNASKYSPIGTGVRMRVTPMEDGRVRLAVLDRGAGLAPRDRELVFRRFVRLDDRAGGQHGVGLGLSVVKAIVEAHGGTVGVDENPGGGSLFWFALPTGWRQGEAC